MADDLARSLENGDLTSFLAPFGGPLRSRVEAWYRNNRTIGVTAARFARIRLGTFGHHEQAGTFTRSLVVGIRTPYDDPGSLPGISYDLTLTRRSTGWTITGWAPSYLVDPLDCSCRLTVTRRGAMVVVNEPHEDFEGWPATVLDEGTEAVQWVRSRLKSTDLRVPKGQVIFLADAPYRWFQSPTLPVERSNITVPLLDATGPYPGIRFSTQSRIVLTLQDSAGRMAALDGRSRLYLSDVIAHESTHQLMNRNATLTFEYRLTLQPWIVEGIAVAVEVLHRRDHPETDDLGYPNPDDPANADPQWLADHVSTRLPTADQLYNSDANRNNWYGVAGSVFLQLAESDGFATMLRVAQLTYQRKNGSPFAFVPDPDRPGRYLPVPTAEKQWLNWFRSSYVN